MWSRQSFYTVYMSNIDVTFYHYSHHAHIHCFIIYKLSYLENTESFANAISSGATSTILPVSVSRAHLGSSGSYTICLETHQTKLLLYTHTQTHDVLFAKFKPGGY